MNNRSITPEDHEVALAEARRITHTALQADPQYRLAQAYMNLREIVRHPRPELRDERRTILEAEGYLTDGISAGVLPYEAGVTTTKLRDLRTRLEVAHD